MAPISALVSWCSPSSSRVCIIYMYQHITKTIWVFEENMIFSLMICSMFSLDIQTGPRPGAQSLARHLSQLHDSPCSFIRAQCTVYTCTVQCTLILYITSPCSMTARTHLLVYRLYSTSEQSVQYKCAVCTVRCSVISPSPLPGP